MMEFLTATVTVFGGLQLVMVWRWTASFEVPYSKLWVVSMVHWTNVCRLNWLRHFPFRSFDFCELTIPLSSPSALINSTISGFHYPEWSGNKLQMRQPINHEWRAPLPLTCMWVDYTLLLRWLQFWNCFSTNFRHVEYTFLSRLPLLRWGPMMLLTSLVHCIVVFWASLLCNLNCSCLFVFHFYLT